MAEEKIIQLHGLLSKDPEHVYSDEELDAIEEVDAAMALRLARVQHMAQQVDESHADEPVDEQAVAEAIEEARRILSQDGGDIELVDIHQRSVRVRMKGACVGCPNAVLDLRNVVERLVKSKSPGVREVVNMF